MSTWIEVQGKIQTDLIRLFVISDFESNLDVVKERIDLFCNHPEWYEEKGIPYTLGILLHGPAGTGKTLFPTQYAAKLLLETDYKIILTRPLISVDEELGYLPGGINEKMHPWIVPIFDILNEFISPQKLDKLITLNLSQNLVV